MGLSYGTWSKHTGERDVSLLRQDVSIPDPRGLVISNSSFYGAQQWPESFQARELNQQGSDQDCATAELPALDTDPPNARRTCAGVDNRRGGSLRFPLGGCISIAMSIILME